MLAGRGKLSSSRLAGVLAPVAGGALIGLFTTVMVSAFPWTITVLIFLGLLTIVPAFLFHDAALYWLSVYLIGLPLEVGKRITNLGHTSQEILTTIGLPPSGDLGVKLYPTDLALLALLIPWVTDLATRRERLYFPRVGYALLAYLLWASLSAFVKAEYFAISLGQLVREWGYFVIYLYVCNNVKARKTARVILAVLTLVLLMEAATTLALYALGQSRESLLQTANLTVTREFEFVIELEEGAVSKATGTFGSASHLAMYLQLLFSVPLALAVMAPTVERRWLNFALFVLSGSAMLVTASRSGAVGFVIGAVACIALLRRRDALSARQLMGAVYVSVLLALVGSTLLYTYMVARPETFTNRFSLLREGALLVAENPFLGVGPNNGTAARLELANRLGYQQGLSREQIPTYDHFYPVHNHFIVVASETGVVGVLLYLAFFVGVVAEAVRRSRSPDPPIAILSIAAASGCVALATHLLGDHFVGNATHSLLFFYAGLTMAFARVERPTPGNP